MSTKAERRPARVAAYEARMAKRTAVAERNRLSKLARLWKRLREAFGQPAAIDTPMGLFIYRGQSQGSRTDRLANRGRQARRAARGGQKPWRARREPDHVHGTVR